MTESETAAPVESFCTNEVEKRRNQWHCERRRQMLSKYPQIKELMTTNPVTGYAMVTLLFLHVAVAYICANHMPLWAALVILYFFNATCVHSAGILCHEITHNLAFKEPLYNKFLLWVASMPMVFRPLTFRLNHLVHHAYLEDLNVNPEYGGEDFFNSPWFTVTQQVWHKILVSIPFMLPVDMIIYHLFYAKYEANAVTRVNRVMNQARSSDVKWLNAANYVLYAYIPIAIYFLGWKAVLFQFLGEAMSASPSHLIIGARYASEHRTIREGQPTNSMYGWQNIVTWNVGYHVEHHDFPNIPWNRIKELHKIAPEYYNTLAPSENYTTLAFKWLRGDPDMSDESYLCYISKRLNYAEKKKA